MDKLYVPSPEILLCGHDLYVVPMTYWFMNKIYVLCRRHDILLCNHDLYVVPMTYWFMDKIYVLCRRHDILLCNHDLYVVPMTYWFMDKIYVLSSPQHLTLWPWLLTCCDYDWLSLKGSVSQTNGVVISVLHRLGNTLGLIRVSQPGLPALNVLHRSSIIRL